MSKNTYKNIGVTAGILILTFIFSYFLRAVLKISGEQ